MFLSPVITMLHAEININQAVKGKKCILLTSAKRSLSVLIMGLSTYGPNLNGVLKAKP